MTTPDEEPKADSELKPGAGRPLVEGPPGSVGEPIPARTVNLTAGVAGIALLGVAGVVTLIVLIVLVLAIVGRIH